MIKGCICGQAPAWPPRLLFAAAVCAPEIAKEGVWTGWHTWAAELCLVGAVEAVAAILLQCGETRGMSGLQARNGARATRPSARGGKGHGQAY